jgi:HD-GYP domain-containing protein (c-di-GMP phosphodiesterase class II)
MATTINIVDPYDVMTTDRIYKRAMGKDETIKEIKKYSRTQFSHCLMKNIHLNFEVVICFHVLSNDLLIN